jgi:integrase
MPATCEMSWEARSRRWWKQRDGKRFVVSCRQLKKQGYLPADAPETKEGSYKAANQWWNDRVSGRVGFDRTGEEEVERRKRVWAARTGLELPPEGRTIAEYVKIAETFGVVVPPDLDPVVARMLFGDERIWADRFRRERQRAAPTEESVGKLIDDYLGLFRSRNRAGEISAAEANDAHYALLAFRDWVGAGASVKGIDYALMERWWLETLKAGVSVPTKRKRLRFPKGFVKWLARRGMVTPLDMDAMRVKYTPAAVPMPNLGEIKRIVEAAAGPLRLHLLLMLNCGMTQVDVASLRQEEVDWVSGRIRRKRTKTRIREKVPVVDYPLWPETFALLRMNRQTGGDLALLTPSGKRWLRDDVDGEGRRRKTDQIGTDYKYLKKRIKTDVRLGMFRKVGANILADEPRFAALAQRFLGHAPTSVAERHYTSDRAGQAHFDEAVVWVGRKLGFDREVTAQH